jgi:hypothetical protein
MFPFNFIVFVFLLDVDFAKADPPKVDAAAPAVINFIACFLFMM